VRAEKNKAHSAQRSGLIFNSFFSPLTPWKQAPLGSLLNWQGDPSRAEQNKAEPIRAEPSKTKPTPRSGVGYSLLRSLSINYQFVSSHYPDSHYTYTRPSHEDQKKFAALRLICVKDFF